MQFNIEKKELLALSNTVHRAASNKNTIPVLSSLLLKLDHENGLTMTATDMEIGIKASSKNIELEKEGSVLVNAHYFYDFIKLLPDRLIQISLQEESTKLNINYGRSSGFINTYGNIEYPDILSKEPVFSFSISQNLLREALRKTIFAATLNHFRPVFTGVLFDLNEKNHLKIVASDTHRLAYYRCTIEEVKIEPLNFIIPIRAVNELLRLLEDNDDLINIGFTDNNVLFYKNNMIFLSRLIEGQYPAYENVIPSNFKTNVIIPSTILVNTLERAKTMPSEGKLKIQHVQFDFQKNEIKVNTFSEVIGEIDEIIEDLKIEGESDFKITFNTNYFLDVVKILEPECENLKIKLSGPLGPALIQNPDKKNYLYVLVPLRTSN